MTMSNARGEGQWPCKPCNRLFPNWEAIMKHKEYMRRTGTSHIHCKFCGQDFKTQAAENFHVMQNHPQEQKLDCPGCGRGPFPRVASLIAHIETGECARLDVSILDEWREKKLEFPRQLEMLTKKAVKNNYSSFVSPKQASGPRHIWGEAQGSEFSFTGAGFPKLSDEGGDASRHEGELSQDVENTAWKGKANLFPNSPPAQKPTDAQLESVTKPSPRMVFESMDPDDPDNPGFNAARYYAEVIEQYVCPKVRCGKVFKNQGGLISHLRSPAHGNRTYRCPYCFRAFKTLTAITSHVESSSVNCRIRDTDNYEAYLDQLTAGIVDVGKRNDDGTLQYNTAESVRAALRGPKADKAKKDTQQVQW